MVHYTGEPALIVLDPSIRNWVLFPIMIIMVLVGILKHYVSSYFTLPTLKSINQIDFEDLRQRNSVLRSINLRQFHSNIHPDAFQSRKKFWISQFKSRTYLKHEQAKVKVSDEPELPDTSKMMDGMMAGMKQNMVSIVPQTLIMAFINAFFSGFLLIKLPFPLTIRFKSMLQSGIMTPDLDTAWVSSLSWYFLNLFGLSPIFRLILGQDNAASDTMTAMNPMSALGSSAMQMDTQSITVGVPEFPAANAPPTLPGISQNKVSGFEKTFDDEVEFLKLAEPWVWVGDGIEARVTALLKARYHV